MQVFFFFDQARCTGCAACAIACKDWNKLPAGREMQWRRVYSTETGRFPRVDVAHLCLSCFHCAEPACAKACPTGAITKRDEDGAVLVDRDACRGCRQCETACPYGAPQYAPGDPRMMKCTFCIDRRAVGLKPACVDACPYFALDAGTESELTLTYGPLHRLSADVLPGIGAEHAATQPGVFVKSRPQRATDNAVMRRNGEIATQLRAVPGPTEAQWRERAATPYRPKPKSDQC